MIDGMGIPNSHNKIPRPHGSSPLNAIFNSLDVRLFHLEIVHVSAQILIIAS